MPLASGTRLGPYEIVAPLASGGMGDVYKARDTRLDRSVAIKVLQEQFSERFEREARAVAALNHAHICQLYDVGANFLVMEYVDGGPLRPTDDPQRVVDLAMQIADGLAAAHDAGVVHRDLKPGNILLTRAGDAKILDFGLALIGPQAAGHRPGDSRLTAIGTVLGTAAYMPPEQVRGEPADARSDLWSLGVILYELATSGLPFDGTKAEIFEAILSRAPIPVRQRNPRISVELAQIIERLLAKDPAARYQTAADVRADLKRLQRGAATVVDPRRAKRGTTWRRFAYRGAAVALAFGAAGGAAYLWSPPPNVAAVPAWQQLTDFADAVAEPSLSPDGRMVAFIRGGRGFPRRGNAQIYIKLLPNGEPIQLTQTPNPKCCPAFSPDGSRVAYTNVTGADTWDTFSVSVFGGEPTPLLGNAAGLSWIHDGNVMFSEIKGSGLHMGVVTAAESRAGRREIYFPDHEREMVHYSHLSPDRRWVLMVEMGQTGGFSQRCRLTPFEAGTMSEIGPSGCASAAWSPDGRWMYFAAQVDGERHLWRQRFPNGEPEQITFGPTEQEGVALAPDGRSLVTVVGQRRALLWLRDASGERQLSQEGSASAPLVSADGRRVYHLFRTGASSDVALRVLDVATGRSERLLPGQSLLDFDVSPDEQQVAFTTAAVSGERRVWLARLDGREEPREIARDADQVLFGAGEQLVFRSLEDTHNVLFRINQDGTGRQQIADLSVVNLFDVSPDGSWASVVASGSTEGYLIPIAGGAPRRLCARANCQAHWSPGGAYLYVRFSAGELGLQRAGQVTVVLPVTPNEALPAVPTDGFTGQSLAAAAAAPGAQILEEEQVVTGPEPSAYVFLRVATQSNLVRIPFE